MPPIAPVHAETPKEAATKIGPMTFVESLVSMNPSLT
jgi:hypothetical protein